MVCACAVTTHARTAATGGLPHGTQSGGQFHAGGGPHHPLPPAYQATFSWLPEPGRSRFGRGWICEPCGAGVHPWLGVQHGDGQFSDGHLERMEEEGDVADLTRVTNRGDECSEEVITIYAMWCKIA